MSFQFLGQRPGEEVRLLTRRHPFILLHTTILVVALWLLPVLVFALGASGALVFWCLMLFGLAGLYILAAAWFAWYRSLILLTTERLMYFEQKGFFWKHISELRLLDIVQVSVSVQGVLETLTHTGTLLLATASSHEAMTIRAVPEAIEIQRDIEELKSA